MMSQHFSTFQAFYYYVVYYYSIMLEGTTNIMVFGRFVSLHKKICILTLKYNSLKAEFDFPSFKLCPEPGCQGLVLIGLQHI